MWSPIHPIDVEGDVDEPNAAAGAEPRVLVAVMNRLRDFAIACDRGWYRIPVKRAPAQIGADYLAFYHTAAFPPDTMWRIRYYAAIRGYRIVTRAELLPEEASHSRAADRYYRLDIGPLAELPHAIPSRHLRRITFISTTLARLMSAHEINDLWESGYSSERLWAAFREAAIDAERRYPIGEGRTAYVVDFAIPSHDGGVAVLVDDDREIVLPGWVILHFSGRQIADDTPSCLDLVRQALRARSGQSRASAST